MSFQAGPTCLAAQRQSAAALRWTCRGMADGAVEAGGGGVGGAASPRTQRSRALLRAGAEARARPAAARACLPLHLLTHAPAPRSAQLARRRRRCGRGPASSAAHLRGGAQRTCAPARRLLLRRAVASRADAARAVLGRLQAFVPALAEANAALAAAMATAPPHAFDIELHGEDGEEEDETREHIAMELACGVVELNDAAAEAAAERACAGGGGGGALAMPAGASSSSDSDDSDDSDSDADAAAGDGGGGGPPQGARAAKGEARGKRSRIEVLHAADNVAPARPDAAAPQREGA